MVNATVAEKSSSPTAKGVGVVGSSLATAIVGHAPTAGPELTQRWLTKISTRRLRARLAAEVFGTSGASSPRDSIVRPSVADSPACLASIAASDRKSTRLNSSHG